MSDLTFTQTGEAPLRHWDLTGPAGTVRFEVAEGFGIVAPSVYLHSKAVFGDGVWDGECPVCGGCYHDALVTRLARQLHQDFVAAGNDQPIRDRLRGWYFEFFEVSS